MDKDIDSALIQTILDSQKNIIVVFHKNIPVLINNSFKEFFLVSSLEEYKERFSSLEENFFPHPSYFHALNTEENENWFDAIQRLDESKRIVSMMTSDNEPRAFSVDIKKVQDYVIAVFEDITQTLIERIMREEHSDIDEKSKAYTKKYFLRVAQSYYDAALFNKKIIGTLKIKITKETQPVLNDDMKIVADGIKSVIRQDDMLIRWEESGFLLIYLLESERNARIMVQKLQDTLKEIDIEGIDFVYDIKVQNTNERMDELLLRVED